MTAAELAGGFEVPAAGELPTHIEDHYLRRIRELPEATQQLMLVAAAEPLGDPALVLRAARRLDIETSALAPAEAAELLRDRNARPVPPSPGALGGLPSRATRQPAAGARSPRRGEPLGRRRRPPRVAPRLGGRGPGRGRRRRARAVGRPSAGSWWGRCNGGLPAARRRADARPGAAPRRALAAAAASIQAGAFTTARGLLATAEAGPLDELQRARIDLLRAQLAFISSRGTDAIPLLLAAARRLEPLDISVARETYVDAFSAALFGARLNGRVGLTRGRRGRPRRAPRVTGCRARDRGPAAGRARCPRRRLRRRRPALPERRCSGSPARRLRPRNGCAGCGRAASSPSRSGMTNTRPRCRAPASRSPVRRGRSASSRSPSAPRTPCWCSAATSPPPQRRSPRRRRSSRRPGSAPRPTER